jgi:hypothetical protein
VLGERFNPGTLKARLEHMVLKTGYDDDQLANLAVKFRADANLEWKYIQDAMVACMQNKIWRCSFATNETNQLNY